MWIPIPSSRATASHRPISPSVQTCLPVAVDGEHADRAVEDDDRRRERRPRAQGERGSSGRRPCSSDSTSAIATVRAGPRGDVRDREALGLGASDRIDAVARPTRPRSPAGLRRSPRRTKQRVSAERRADLLDARRAATASRSSSDGPCARSRRAAARGRAPPRARPPSAAARARAPPRPRACAAARAPPWRRHAARCVVAIDEHGDHALAGDERHERGALGPDRPRDGLVDQRRGVRVEDRHRRDVEDGARDARRLAAEVEAKAPPERRSPCRRAGRAARSPRSARRRRARARRTRRRRGRRSRRGGRGRPTRRRPRGRARPRSPRSTASSRSRSGRPLLGLAV